MIDSAQLSLALTDWHHGSQKWLLVIVFEVMFRLHTRKMWMDRGIGLGPGENGNRNSHENEKEMEWKEIGIRCT